MVSFASGKFCDGRVALLEIFAEAKLLIFKGAKKGKGSTWETSKAGEALSKRALRLEGFPMKESFAEAKLTILRARKRQGSTRETSKAGRLTKEKLCVGRVLWKALQRELCWSKARDFKGAKKTKLTWETGEAGRLSWEDLHW